MTSSAISCAEFQAEEQSKSPPLLVDVRKKEAYLAAKDRAHGALRRDPETVAVWAGQLPRSSRVVVYCAHGREVSQRVSAELAKRGFEAHYLEGGIEAGWRCLLYTSPSPRDS